jgi:hypothetical protein
MLYNSRATSHNDKEFVVQRKTRLPVIVLMHRILGFIILSVKTSSLYSRTCKHEVTGREGGFGTDTPFSEKD